MRRALLPLAVLAACSRFGAVYPPRPAPSEGPPLADPPPSRVAIHLAVTSSALRGALEDAVPHQGDGTFPLLGSDRRYTWSRDPLDLSLAQGRIVLRAHVNTTVAMPLGAHLDSALDLRVDGEPVVSTEYAVKLQSVEVHVTSTDTKLKVADRLAGIYDRIASAIDAQLRAFSQDLRPLLGEAYARVAKPIEVPVGDAKGCASLRVLGVEAGPTVLADGIEKDLALVVAPSITLPCAEEATAPQALPPLSNVASIATGPFTVTVPIAARYDELTKAMTMAFTDGKLFFSKEYPGLFLSDPELYESQGVLVLKLHLSGPVPQYSTTIDGDIFLSGHPAVIDNELRIPDLEPTIETKNLLLYLKALVDGDRMRDEARQALRLDIGQRLRSVRDKLGPELTFGGGGACFAGNVDRVEVKGVYAHAAYLRVYVDVTARARATMPCESAAPAEQAAGNASGG